MDAKHSMFTALNSVAERAVHVRLDNDAIESTADWMSYEELAWPDFRLPMHPDLERKDLLDFLFWTSTINFAFTDFDDHRMFSVELDGTTYSDSDAMVACLSLAWRRGLPVLQGKFWAELEQSEMQTVFSGNIEIPMLEARHAVLREVGKKIQAEYGDRFHHFLETGSRHAFDDGNGLVERLVESFPSFRDVSFYGPENMAVWFHKRAQLLFWQLHSRFSSEDFFVLADPEQMTAFADYIVPVALRVMKILRYDEALERRVKSHEPIEAHSEEEVEIRAASLVACRRLREAINRRRPSDRQIVDPVLDTRLWTHYHRSHWPHHLTVTTAY